jgi:hypothetical protein
MIYMIQIFQISVTVTMVRVISIEQYPGARMTILKLMCVYFSSTRIRTVGVDADGTQMMKVCQDSGDIQTSLGSNCVILQRQ